MKKVIFLTGFALVCLACVFLIQVQVSKGEGDDIVCGANSHLSGEQCLCDAGYGAASGSNECVPDSQVCAQYGPSHRVGNDCVCNDGYKIIDGSGYCESLSAACAKFDAVWSDATNDCVCRAGYHEDQTANKCMPDTSTTPKTDSSKPSDTTKTDLFPKTDDSQKVPATTTTTPKTTTLPIDPVNDLMKDSYSKLPPTVQAVISENKEPANQIIQTPFSPSGDLYSGSSASTNAQESVMKSLNLVSPSEQESGKEQIALLVNMAETSDNEVNIMQGGMGEKLQESFVEQKYTQELQTWNNQVQEAEKQSKLKVNVNPQDYNNSIEMESRLKAQIAALEKIVGYNHLRCLEATRVMKFENMPTDYRAYYKGQSAENIFNAASEGVAFDGAARNVTATTDQIRELKAKLNSDYPTNWKSKFLAVPDQPVRDKVVAPDNIFNVFEKLKNQ